MISLHAIIPISEAAPETRRPPHQRAAEEALSLAAVGKKSASVGTRYTRPDATCGTTGHERAASREEDPAAAAGGEGGALRMPHLPL